ncbi:NAD(P)H-dependent oxidoreductase [Roseiarcaceae bacterium H3SJ34-1]|uniref:FMN-dependent NADH-azoreductase n=1 Tax=Terripilifer ovatus TaxID=3032367 RepID=UPI003AB9A8BE|nr:NAD(P)H-dependent oxidoreductase [Roseiarcaceae bacterium H3SJ34-1]
MQLLHIDSSITGAQSVSRQLTAGVVARLKQTSPGLSVTYRDLAAEPVPQQSPSILFAKGGVAVDAEVVDEVAATETVLDEFLAADIVVVGAPMYNFGIPSQLKAWIDCLAVAGKTFSYSATGVQGLAGGKRVIIASSRGGFYSAPSPMASLDHQESFLAGFFGFIGVTDISFVRAEGVNISPQQRETALAAALAEATTLKAA